MLFYSFIKVNNNDSLSLIDSLKGSAYGFNEDALHQGASHTYAVTQYTNYQNCIKYLYKKYPDTTKIPGLVTIQGNTLKFKEW